MLPPASAASRDLLHRMSDDAVETRDDLLGEAERAPFLAAKEEGVVELRSGGWGATDIWAISDAGHRLLDPAYRSESQQIGDWFKGFWRRLGLAS